MPDKEDLEFTKKCIMAYRGELTKEELIKLQREMSDRLVCLKLEMEYYSDVEINYIAPEDW